jgi:hypothetical protein
VEVAVGDAQVDPSEPTIWKILSGGAFVTQLGFTTQSLPPEHIKAPPGLRNAAPLFDCTVRSVHPHSPFVVKFRFACTDTQYVPALRVQNCGRSIPNDPVAAPDAIGTSVNEHTAVEDGRVPPLV